MRASFVFDANRCTGCQACELACTIENGLEPGTSWREIYTFNAQRLPDIPLFHLSLACNHCADPACLEACPTNAYSKDPTTGAVLIDQDRCMGCKYCSWACPYDAPRFDAHQGVMTKCTFCNDRIHAGLAPACAELCPTGALQFDRLEEQDITHEVEGLPQTDLEPALRVVPLRPGGDPRTPVAPADSAIGKGDSARAKPKVTLRSEWSLAAFTVLAAVLFALIAAALAGSLRVNPLAFSAAAGSGMLLATAHLGRKSRAWRAVLGFGHSWLSREIVFFSAFVTSGAAYLVWTQSYRAIGWAAVATGLAALYSMDHVYRYAGSSGAQLHSARVLFTGVFLATVLMGQTIAAVALGTGKLSLYLARKARLAGSGRPARHAVTLARVLVGFALPVVLAPAVSGLPIVWMASALVVGELIDRSEFYAELEFVTPALQMKADLTARRTAAA